MKQPDNTNSQSFSDRRYVNLLDAPKYNNVSQMYLINENDKSKNLPFKWFADLRYCWRIPIPHSYPLIQSNVFQSERIQKIIETIAEEELVSINVLKKQVGIFYNRMRASFSKFMCKIASYILFKAFRRLFSRIIICQTQMEQLNKANASNIPILYLPMHKSHLDYLLITWTVWHWQIRLPHIASGDNLNLLGLGWFLRSFGAFFIRRRLHSGSNENPSNTLYRTVLNTYMIELLKNNFSIEFFLEGTRSRFGKTLCPKNGLISNIVSAVRKKEILDVYLVPVSISYDRTIEGFMVDELKGLIKKRESLFSVLKGFFFCFKSKTYCGDIIINYGTPVKLSERLKILAKNIAIHGNLINLKHEINSNSYRELVPWQSDNDRILIRSIGYDMIYQAQKNQSITTSSLIAMLITCHFREKSIAIFKFLILLNALAQEIKQLNYFVIGWDLNNDDEIDIFKRFKKGLKYLSDSIKIVDEKYNLVSEKSEFYNSHLQITTYSFEKLLKLAYYKNGALAPYILISMSALSILSFCEKKVSLNECVERTILLCDFLQFETIFCSPCDNLRLEITKALKFLNYNESQNLENYIESSEKNSLFNNLNKTGSQTASFGIRFYSNIVRPFLQSCLLVAVDLISKPPTNISDNNYIRNLIVQYPAYNFDINIVPEAVNQDSIYNAIKLLRTKEIVSREGLYIINDDKAKMHINSFIMFLNDKVREAN